MPKKRFTNEQIAFALRQAENGTLVGEICRKMGVAEATFYRWKKVWVINHKRVYRLYREEGLSIRTRTPKRRRSSRYPVGRATVEHANEVWSMDARVGPSVRRSAVPDPV